MCCCRVCNLANDRQIDTVSKATDIRTQPGGIRIGPVWCSRTWFGDSSGVGGQDRELDRGERERRESGWLGRHTHTDTDTPLALGLVAKTQLQACALGLVRASRRDTMTTTTADEQTTQHKYERGSDGCRVCCSLVLVAAAGCGAFLLP